MNVLNNHYEKNATWIARHSFAVPINLRLPSIASTVPLRPVHVPGSKYHPHTGSGVYYFGEDGNSW
jgi:hypothetical protein